MGLWQDVVCLFQINILRNITCPSKKMFRKIHTPSTRLVMMIFLTSSTRRGKTDVINLTAVCVSVCGTVAFERVDRFGCGFFV